MDKINEFNSTGWLINIAELTILPSDHTVQ